MADRLQEIEARLEGHETTRMDLRWAVAEIKRLRDRVAFLEKENLQWARWENELAQTSHGPR